jgi:antitoxin component YwqK of YwqJK toxin-antitoxin module
VWLKPLPSWDLLESLRQPKLRDPFYDNGNPRYKGKLKEGQMHGPWEFFHKDGSLMRSGRFNLGKQIGIWTTYDRTGHPHKETDFGS